MSNSKKQRSPIGSWISSQAPLAPPREQVRIVKPNQLGEMKVITRVAVDLKKLDDCIDAIERSVTMALMNETGKTTYTIQMLGAAEVVLSEHDVKVQGNNTVQADSGQSINASLVGLSRDIALDIKSSYSGLFEEAKSFIGEIKADRKDWQEYAKGLLQENVELRTENAALKAGANPEQEGKGMLYTAAASTLMDLPALVAKGIDAIFTAKALAASAKQESQSKELAELNGAQKQAVEQVKAAAAKIADTSILKIFILLAQNQPFAAEMAKQLTDDERAAMKPAFIACMNALQEGSK